MNHVCKETAILLNQSGFPAPPPCAEQFWFLRRDFFDGKNILEYWVKCVLVTKNGCFYFSRIEHKIDDVFSHPYLQRKVFAPTASDIMKEIGWPAYLGYDNYKKVFYVDGQPNQKYFEHENPAEAAAMAWISMNQNQ